ncbi:NUDIX hydrolase [Actinospongicola halichondriae]|uniref:NUDIX hydrolase n=1 Tax=Actinospongicola halichondriae TaxID=3236844 RepID=UPI003D3944DD
MTVRGGPQHIPRPPGATAGPPAPWSGAKAPTLAEIRAALAESAAPLPSPAESSSHSASAVLVPLYEEAGDVWVVLTRRSWQLRSHTGEVSFPGGRRDAGDVDLWDTATREAMEEIDLDPDVPERIGELDHLSTVTSQSFIVPYVGALPGRPDLTANDDEVDAILHVRLAELLDPEVHRSERWSWEGFERTIHFFELVGDTIWGATGTMLVDLLTRVTAVDPDLESAR